MDVFRVTGARPLHGTVPACGAKNAALPLFAAALLTDETVTLSNVPDLSDVRFMAEIVRHLGADVERAAPDTWRITAKKLTNRAPYDLVRKMRASVCLMGPLLGRLRSAIVSLPGGCVIGPRPIDLHLKGFAGLGCNVTIHDSLRERAIVEGVLTTCKCLGIRTVAEMVEKEDQHRILLDLGVDLGQGWLYGRPAAEIPPPAPARFGKRMGAKEAWG